MSLAGYFFGNVDEQGRLESDLDDVNSKLNEYTATWNNLFA